MTSLHVKNKRHDNIDNNNDNDDDNDDDDSKINNKKAKLPHLSALCDVLNDRLC